MTSEATTMSGFRLDINGLRAWAVLAVVLFHFGVPGFSGGYVGVDVFFVISGLLMTGIVTTGLERGRFSVFSFYMARARRIVPALLVLCAVLLVLGWKLLLPTDYRLLATHGAASLAFISNIVYWKETGYFDSHSHDKWLLHTWSLAVEWQFYLVLPLALMWVWKWRPGRRSLGWTVAIGLALSYALCALLTPFKSQAAFFLLPTRAWEMLAGGGVFLLANRWPRTARQSRALELCGLGLIVGAIFFLNGQTPWPGWRAIVPTLGAALVLLAARNSSAWTGNAFAQWVGTRSYSIYLWHWPLTVALRYADLQQDVPAIAVGLTLTFLLGHLSYIWVETPARRGLEKVHLRKGATVLASTSLAVFAAGAAIYATHGVTGRFTPEMERFSQSTFDRNPRRTECHSSVGRSSPSCQYGQGPVRAIVLGDSHADAMITGIAAAVSPTRPGSVIQWSYSACPIVQGAHQVLGEPTNECEAFVDWAMQKLATMPSDIPLVVINRHGSYLRGNFTEGQFNIPWVYFSQRYTVSEPAYLQEYAQHLTETICKLREHHAVYLVRPLPEMNKDVPKTARSMLWGPRQDATMTLAAYKERNDVVLAAQDAARDRCGAKILDPLPYLCEEGLCRGSKAGRALFYDDNHLSESGNKLLTAMFAQVFN